MTNGRLEWGKEKMIILLILLLILSTQKINAWGGDVHNFLCPSELKNVDLEGRAVGCGVADSAEFQKTYPFAEAMNHLCLDNKADCPPRAAAKYYVKRYYLEGKKDSKLLAAAAHLIQDAACPDHWFPMRGFGERIFVPFAPSWVSKTEAEVSRGLSSQQTGWSVVRQYHGKTIILNQAYMDGLKSEIAQFTASEPKEDLATLETQIKTRSFWQKVRSYREWALIVVLILLPFSLFYLWKWTTKKSNKTDLIITFFLEVIFLGILAMTYLY